MDFQQRLHHAIQRGQRRQDAKLREEQARALSEEECRRLHAQLRLALSEHVEACLRQLPDHFPGFKFETVVGSSGWGAAVSRDDLALEAGQRTNLYSRLELVVRPCTKYHVLDLAAKGTVRNKEVYNRSHFERLAEVDLEAFHELVERWVLEYAELYAGSS